MAFHEDHGRSIVKALTYRAIIICSDAILIFALTRNKTLTFSFIGVSNIASTILYFLHERAWNKIHWGKKHLPDNKRMRKSKSTIHY